LKSLFQALFGVTSGEAVSWTVTK